MTIIYIVMVSVLIEEMSNALYLRENGWFIFSVVILNILPKTKEGIVRESRITLSFSLLVKI